MFWRNMKMGQIELHLITLRDKIGIIIIHKLFMYAIDDADSKWQNR